MNATAVASSNQMFSPFGQQTPSSSTPIFNPFAPKPIAENPFGLGGAATNNSSRKPNALSTNPFAPKKTNQVQEDAPAPHGGFGQSHASTVTKASITGSGGGKRGLENIRSKSVRFDDSDPGNDAFTSKTNDPHAIKVYQQLRKDGLTIPPWPSQPGDPKNKAQMAKFRERYEDYRSQVRASLTKAGLIDDPEKRRTLQDAIDFRGICEDMCPEFEKITRITEVDIPGPEKDPLTGFASTTRMVKKLARSAAGQEAPLPMDVLSIPTLRRTLNYLIDDLLRDDANLFNLHGYLWDRTRAIRRDFSFFSSLDAEDIKTQAYVLENIARFHVTALHLLSKEGKAPEDFVEQQELEQLGKALLSLRDIYDDCNAQGIICANEAEFRAYYLLFHAYDPNILDVLQRQWRRSLWTESEEIRIAVSLVEALHNTQDFHGPLKDAPSLAASSAHQSYFRIVEDRSVSYTMACFAECHFPHLRRSLLRNVKRALSRPKEGVNDVTAEALNKFLRFDTIQQAIDFAELHDLEFSPSGSSGDPSLRHLVLDNKQHLPHHRLQHQFSQTLVERKRGSRTLPDVIHSTVFESARGRQDSGSFSAESSLFVEDEDDSPTRSVSHPESTTSSSKPVTGLGNTVSNGIGAFSPKANPFSPSSMPSAGLKQTSSSAINSTRSTPKTVQPSTNIPFSAPAISTTPSILPSDTKLHPNNDNTASTHAPMPSLRRDRPLQDEAMSSTSQSAVSNRFQLVNPASPLPSNSPKYDSGIQAPELHGTGTTSQPYAAERPLENVTPITPAGVVFGHTKTSSTGERQPTSSHTQGLQSTALVGKADTASASQLSTHKFSTQNSAALLSPPQATTQAVSVRENLSFPQLNATSPESSSGPNNALDNNSTPSFTFGNDVPNPATMAYGALAKLDSPPRDLMRDFTEWYVLGDNGLLEEFQTYYLENALSKLFLRWEIDVQEEQLRVEDERDAKAVKEFRTYNLSVRYFYRWKQNAREKRLKFLRRTERERLRQYQKAQHIASVKASQEAAERADKEESATARKLRQDELLGKFKQTRESRRQLPETSFPASRLEPRNRRDSMASAVNRHFNLPQSGFTTPNRSRSSSVSRGGAKTRALREELLGDNKQAYFRRSLPSAASSERSSPDNASRVSQVSERWRLKAMGIVQMPDGTAVPESLLPRRRPSFDYLPASSSVASTSPPPSESFGQSTSQRYAYPTVHDLPGSSTMTDVVKSSSKRKRSSGDSLLISREDDDSGSLYKRIMNESTNAFKELRESYEDLKEGAQWYKDQSNKLYTDIVSRGGTPMERSI